jgi:hypothetical protein
LISLEFERLGSEDVSAQFLEDAAIIENICPRLPPSRTWHLR